MTSDKGLLANSTMIEATEGKTASHSEQSTGRQGWFALRGSQCNMKKPVRSSPPREKKTQDKVEPRKGNGLALQRCLWKLAVDTTHARDTVS